MNNWEEFIEISLPEKKDFYIHLNMEGISDADYVHAKKVCKNFKIRNLCDYHDLYVQIYTLLLVDVFENFRNKCLKKNFQANVNLVTTENLLSMEMKKLKYL